MFWFVIRASCKIVFENTVKAVTVGHLNTSPVSLCHEDSQKHTLPSTAKGTVNETCSESHKSNVAVEISFQFGQPSEHRGQVNEFGP